MVYTSALGAPQLGRGQPILGRLEMIAARPALSSQEKPPIDARDDADLKREKHCLENAKLCESARAS